MTEPRLVDDGLTGAETGMLALLAAAGLAGAGLLAARSRRKRSDEVVEDDEAVEDYAPANSVLTPELAPVLVREPALERFAQPAGQPASPAPAVAGPVPAGDARTALLERMVAAEPDEENPYVSRKRRVRRARMILAQREQHRANRGDDDSFDWRTYRPTGRPAEAPTKAEASADVPVPYPT